MDAAGVWGTGRCREGGADGVRKGQKTRRLV